MFQLTDQLARPELGRPGERSGRQHRVHGIYRLLILPQLPLYLGTDMHHMRVFLDAHVFFHLYCPEFAEPAQIISSQIHQHIMLRALLRILQKPFLQLPVFLIRLSSRPGSRQRKGPYHSVLHLDQRFRRSPGDFHIITGKIKHIRRRIGGTQNPVGIQQAPLVARLHGIGKHQLEDVSLMNIMPDFFNLLAVFLFGENRFQLFQKASPLNFLRLPMPDNLFHFIQSHHRPAVALVQMIRIRIDDQNDLLAEIVITDQLVKKHQVHIIKTILIRSVQFKRRLPVLDIFIGKVTDQPSRQRRKILQSGRAVLLNHLLDKNPRMIGLHLLFLSPSGDDCQQMILTGNLHGRIITQKCITSPLSGILHAFQQKAVAADLLQRPQRLHRRTDIRQDLPGHRNASVIPRCRDPLHLVQCHLVHCFCLLLILVPPLWNFKLILVVVSGAKAPWSASGPFAFAPKLDLYIKNPADDKPVTDLSRAG